MKFECEIKLCISDNRTTLEMSFLPTNSSKRFVVASSINYNNNPIYKAPKALASEALAAGQSWVLIKSLTEEARLKPRFKDRQ